LRPLTKRLKDLIKPPAVPLERRTHRVTTAHGALAIRRLIERALGAEPSAPHARSKGAPEAVASHEINKLGDKSATDEERATRKRRLISGPKEFRGMRRK
jgi:hypothetical protein